MSCRKSFPVGAPQVRESGPDLGGRAQSRAPGLARPFRERAAEDAGADMAAEGNRAVRLDADRCEHESIFARQARHPDRRRQVHAAHEIGRGAQTLGDPAPGVARIQNGARQSKLPCDRLPRIDEDRVLDDAEAGKRGALRAGNQCGEAELLGVKDENRRSLAHRHEAGDVEGHAGDGGPSQRRPSVRCLDMRERNVLGLAQARNPRRLRQAHRRERGVDELGERAFAGFLRLCRRARSGAPPDPSTPQPQPLPDHACHTGTRGCASAATAQRKGPRSRARSRPLPCPAPGLSIILLAAPLACTK